MKRTRKCSDPLSRRERAGIALQSREGRVRVRPTRAVTHLPDPHPYLSPNGEGSSAHSISSCCVALWPGPNRPHRTADALSSTPPYPLAATSNVRIRCSTKSGGRAAGLTSATCREFRLIVRIAKRMVGRGTRTSRRNKAFSISCRRAFTPNGATIRVTNKSPAASARGWRPPGAGGPGRGRPAVRVLRGPDVQPQRATIGGPARFETCDELGEEGLDPQHPRRSGEDQPDRL